MRYITAINDWIDSTLNECWNWFSGLHQDEWFVVLAIGASIGFICMRGFGSKERV